MDDRQGMLTLEISVRVSNAPHNYPGLEVRETATLKPRSFLEVAKILGQFHDLVSTLDESHA